MKTPQRRIIATVLAFSVMTVTPVAAASESGSLINPATDSNLHAVQTQEGAELVDNTKTAVDSDENINLHTDATNLDWQNASAIESGGQKFVSIPINNEGTEFSNISVRLDENGNVKNYTEAHFYEITETSGRVVLYQEGVLEVDQISEAEEPEQETTSFRGIRDAVSELNRCLSAAGIPAWIVAGAAGACSLAGGWAGILACYTAAGVFGGTVGYCAGNAANKL